MIVHFMCVYYSQWAHENLAKRTQEQWYSFKFCRAVKRRNINGDLSIRLRSGVEAINQSNVGRAREIFGKFIDHTCKTIMATNPVLIPVPSKDGLIGANTFRSLQMAQNPSLHIRIIE